MFKAAKRTLTAAAVIAAATAPSAATAATARSELNPSPRGVAIVLGHTANPQASAYPGHRARVASVPRCPRVGPCISPYSIATHSSGGHSAHPTAASSQQAFQWGDAGIGAAGMLLLLSAGGAVAIATRRQRHRITTS